MANEKNETPKGKSLSQRLNDINFSNSQIPFLQNMQDNKIKMGRKQKKNQSSTKIQGLETLKNTLGRQNMRKQSNYRTNKI